MFILLPGYAISGTRTDLLVVEVYWRTATWNKILNCESYYLYRSWAVLRQ